MIYIKSREKTDIYGPAGGSVVGVAEKPGGLDAAPEYTYR